MIIIDAGFPLVGFTIFLLLMLPLFFYSGGMLMLGSLVDGLRPDSPTPLLCSARIPLLTILLLTFFVAVRQSVCTF